MTIHATVIAAEQFSDWQGKAAVRLDLRTKHAKKPGSDLHLYVEPASPLATLLAGARVGIQAQRGKK